MNEHRYGRQILAEMQCLYLHMKAGKPKYGRDGLYSLISEHVPTVARTCRFRAELSSLILQDTSWGRRVFIHRVFELIRREFGIEVPNDPDYVPKAAKADAMAEAVEAQIALVEMYEDDLRLERARMEAEHRPWDDD
ncbi:hypothetical protein GPK29_09880 [Aeromonas hydrophila]|uniref:hypothetical protein n=1 Tax=Aeromonas TaxID=642 RepID=UPI001C5B8192|nr:MULTISPECIES: hypothetical protein [Aeromonas]MBW3795246.1 hypothetical protein [Aeromonas hydrophila]MBW3801362.1 hypothetical protein [Aeromonas hydrophila]MBW3817276.1 hypothetical protein [Aeromonas hydrophila]MCV3283167.1 hypothetical protein [Aeromonas veronii]